MGFGGAGNKRNGGFPLWNHGGWKQGLIYQGAPRPRQREGSHWGVGWGAVEGADMREPRGNPRTEQERSRP